MPKYSYSPEILQTVRDIPLARICDRFLIPQGNQGKYWREAGHFIKVGEDNIFFDFYAKRGGKGAIDLIIHLFDYSFTQAIEYLIDYENIMIFEVNNRQTETKTKKTKFKPVKDNSNWHKIRHWLINSRKLQPSIVDELYQKKLINADNYSNALFVLRTPDKKKNGFALKGRFQKFNYINNPQDQGWFWLGYPTEHIYIFESAIDAISLYQLIKNNCNRGIYLATSGTANIPALEKYKYLHIATDCDYPGELFAWKIAAKYPNKIILRHIPLMGKDFNADLMQEHSSYNQWWKKNMGKHWSKLLDSNLKEKEMIITQQQKNIQKLINEQYNQKQNYKNSFAA